MYIICTLCSSILHYIDTKIGTHHENVSVTTAPVVGKQLREKLITSPM